MEIVSFAQRGYAGEIVKVEADLRRGIPAIDIVGLPDGAVREARERMRAAIRNSGLDFPRERILINLSPADLKKEGSSFDLPIALAVLLASKKTEKTGENGPVMVLGELELSGAVRPVRGILAAVSRGLENGIRTFMVPEQNVAEAEIRRDAGVIGVRTLSEAVRRLDSSTSGMSGTGEKRTPGGQGGPGSAAPPYAVCWTETGDGPTSGFEDVRGQDTLVRALEIAAAGGHHLIAYGPPGCGKTLALERLPALLPEMDDETAVTVTRIHSIAGILDDQRSERCSALLRRPPFRKPHQSASLEGMTGGGAHCRPGEISLAHGGVLFLDEAALFRSSVLQSLRAPLETGAVTVSRAGRSDTFPARFQLLVAVNPCPCGNFGTAGRICTCTPEMIEQYWKRMTAPLLDRIDLRVSVGMPKAEDLVEKGRLTTAGLRSEIARARTAQWTRNRSVMPASGNSWLNAHLEPDETVRLCALASGVQKLFVRSMEAARLSGRGGHGILKVARTVADLEGEAEIREEHLLEAVQFRRWNGSVPDFL